MNFLEIKLIEFKSFEITEQIAEFFIDGKPLIEFIDDIRHLGNSDSHFNPGSACMKRFFKSELLGKKSPQNIFSGNRVVLYRCHCACDHCGFLSTKLAINENTIEWQGLAWEHDETTIEYFDVGTFIFDKKQYTKAVKKF